MTEEIRCEICNRKFKDADGLAMHNKAKHLELTEKPKKSLPIKKIRNYRILISAVVLIGLFLIWGFSSIKTLPPTDMQGHVEQNPSSHILKEQMSITIQKHMLEHADGIDGGRGGVIINYNCKDYECEEDLIEKLETFAVKYDYAYVAPFKGMDAKIALTKLNKIEVLEEYDNEKIKEFIEIR
mgnify:FL=1